MKRALPLLALLTLGCSAVVPGAGQPPPSGSLEAAGLRWLLERQAPNGGWGPHATTALAAEALERFGQTDAAVRGRAWLGAVPPPRDPFAASARVRLFECATLSLRALEGAQRGDGRWRSPGLPDAIVTALACAALQKVGPDADRDCLIRGRAWLRTCDAPVGWAAAPAREAERRILAARAAGLLDPDEEVVEGSLEKIGLDPRWAASLAEAHEVDADWPERAQLRALRSGRRARPADLLGYLLVSEALAGARPSRRHQWRRALRVALRAQQRPDGSWCGSVTATAAALLALAP